MAYDMAYDIAPDSGTQADVRKAGAAPGILNQVALGYSAFIDRNRAVTATRLTVFPMRPDAVLDAAQLLAAVAEVWPAGGGRVSLNVVSEGLLRDLLRAGPAANLMVEVPAFMAADPDQTEALCALHANGSTLLLKGRPLRELPRAVLPCFTYSIIELSDDRRVAARAGLAAGDDERLSLRFSAARSQRASQSGEFLLHAFFLERPRVPRVVAGLQRGL